MPTKKLSDDKTADELADLADRLVGRIWAHFQSRVAEFGLSMPEAKVLQALDGPEMVPMRTVAERVHANPSNITVVVARLDGRGYVTREGTSDRRVKGVRLTKAGLDLRRRLADRLREDHPAVGDLSHTQQTALLRLLRALDL